MTIFELMAVQAKKLAEAAATGIKLKGSVQTIADLPALAAIGDAYTVIQDNNTEHVKTASGWVKLGPDSSGGGKTLYRHSISARYSKQRLSFWAITSDENAYTLDTLPWPTYGIGTYEDATYKAAIAIWIRVAGSGLDVKYICDFTTDTPLSTISCSSITDTVTEI